MTGFALLLGFWLTWIVLFPSSFGGWMAKVVIAYRAGLKK